jgi:hypothetical protein
MAKTQRPAAHNRAASKPSNKIDIGHAPMIFGRMNYLLVIISVIVVTIGFLIMMGKEGNIYDTRRTVIAPIVVLVGFGIAGYAIFYRKKTGDKKVQE